MTHPILERYFAYLRLKNLSPQTIAGYKYTLGALFRFLGEPGATQITTADLRRYVASLQARGLSDWTVSGQVTAIKTFFSFLVDEGYRSDDPSDRIPRPKVGKRLPQALTISETKALFKAMDGASPIARRNSLIFKLIYAGGLRIGEALNLRVEDVDLEDGAIRVVGKGNKERKIWLKPFMLKLLKEQIERTESGKLLFPGGSGGSLSPAAVYPYFKQHVEKAGINKHVTPHTLRHSIAVHYLMDGAPISFVQRLLGHASLATTGVYTRLADEMTRKIAIETPTAVDGLVEKGLLTEEGVQYWGEVKRQSGFLERVLE